MSFRKRFICFMLAALLLLSLPACGKGTAAGEASGQGQTAAGASENRNAVPEKLTGRLAILDPDYPDQFPLRGLRLVGNQFGTQDDINGKASSLTDIRCVFALNEWVEIYPDADADELSVWVLRHRGDWGSYETLSFSEETPGFASVCSLSAPDGEDPETTPWGSFYLNPEDCEAGYYDFVFTEKGKAVAVLLTRFFGEDELSGKSGAELEALMHEE